MIFGIKDILYILLFAVLIIVLGLLPPLLLPKISVYITAQSMGVLLAGGILGARRAALSVIVFLLLAALQLPVIAGGGSGVALLTGQTGGFFIGWILAAYITGLLVEHFWHKLNFAIASGIMIFGGIVVIYVPGILWVGATGTTSLIDTLKLTSVYMPGDIIKSIICAILILLVKERFYHIAPIATNLDEDHAA